MLGKLRFCHTFKWRNYINGWGKCINHKHKKLLTTFMLGMIKAVLITFEGEPWAPWSSPPASPRSCRPGEEEGEVAPLDHEPPCPAGLPSHLLHLKHLVGALASPSWSLSPSSLPHSLPPTRLITLSHILASLLSGQSETINAMTDQEIFTPLQWNLFCIWN